MTIPPSQTSRLHRAWIDERHEPSELKNIAISAIDAFENLATGSGNQEESLDQLYNAASHPRFMIWEVGLPLLAEAAERSVAARTRIKDLSNDVKAEIRRRSVQYLCDRHSRSFCLELLLKLLHDRSSKVRGFAANRACHLGLKELLPRIERMRDDESNAEARFDLDFVFHLMRDNYFEYENANGYNLVLNFPETYPTRWYCPGQITRELVSRIGIESLRLEVRLKSHLDETARLWEWDTEWCEIDGVL